MKTTYTLVLAIIIASSAKAQFDAAKISASFSGNYTMYKGDFQRSTPGAKIDIGYGLTEKSRLALGYTYHMPIKVPSSVLASDGANSKQIASEIKYNFSSISLTGSYSFVGTDEDDFNLYAAVGAAYVAAKYEEQTKEAVPSGYMSQDQMEPGKETGFTINLGLGTQYRVGAVQVFGDAGIALPANQTNGQYVTNNIPSHFVFNAGIRIPFGTGDY